ncbi:hypothetical protein FACS1894122_02490 [Alphaproteobacteria bacterium]|nr:hypothetical protein FACS1894122_02490 [Alphaproteobacteria bacterium]
MQFLFIVLPRACPKYNGGIERSNRTLREEFYARNDLQTATLEEIRVELKKAVQKYNEYRPHNRLKGLGPRAKLTCTIYIKAFCNFMFQNKK